MPPIRHQTFTSTGSIFLLRLLGRRTVVTELLFRGLAQTDVYSCPLAVEESPRFRFEIQISDVKSFHFPHSAPCTWTPWLPTNLGP
jgi:hypothetical protein